MKSVSRLFTPLTTGMFLVSTVSGIALFFHWNSSLFKSMHEWLSFVLLVPFCLLHVWKNWGSLVNYTRNGMLFIVLGLSVAVAIPFALSSLNSSGSGGNPAFRVARLMTDSPLITVAPLLKQSPEALQDKILQLGYRIESPQDSLEKIAATSGANGMKLLTELLPKGPQQPQGQPKP